MNKIVLKKKDYYEFYEGGLLIVASLNEESSCFRLSARIFSEREFIPFSVRDCVEQILNKKKSKYPLFLQINEEEKAVDLVQEFVGGANISLVKLLRLFSFAARSWARLLKKLAKRDLFYI